MKQKKAIISLGGSVIYPKEPNKKFLSRFRNIILRMVKKGHKFAIFTGGGALARKFQNDALKLGIKDPKILDWLGIRATVINAEMVWKLFGKYAHGKVINDPTSKVSFSSPIIICSGWKPGWSTDYDAVLLAKKLGINSVINVSNVDYVYNKNPKTSKNAKPLKEISWKSYRKMVGSRWTPGLNTPFDPIASREAEKSGIKVYMIGKNLDNLEKVLEEKKFKGTLIGQ